MRSWIVIGIKTGVPWPKTEAEVDYRDHTFILKPEAEDLAPSIAFHLPEGMEHQQGVTLCREFMSALAWVEGQPVKEIMIGGGGRPHGIGKGPRWQTIQTLSFNKDYIPEPSDPKAKLALALYREALNVNSDAYAFLGYFKILNILFGDGPSQKKWITDNIQKVTDHFALERITDLKKTTQDLGDHLYHSGRCAVAHAFDGVIVNPDSQEDVSRLKKELPIIKSLAELVIEQELGVKSQSTVWREHLYELDGFRKMIPDYIQEKLKNKETLKILPPLSFPDLKVGIRGRPDYRGFERLKFECVNMTEGSILIYGGSSDGLVEILLGLNFYKERLDFNLFKGVRIYGNGTRASLEYAIGYHQFLIDLIGNGEFMVSNIDTGEVVGRTNPYLAINIDLTATIKNLEDRIKDLEAKLALTI